MMKRLTPEMLEMLDAAREDAADGAAIGEALRVQLLDEPDVPLPTIQPRQLSYRVFHENYLLVETMPGAKYLLPYSAVGLLKLSEMMRDELIPSWYAGSC
jgi:hypothetical protein